ncbi:MAG: ATP-dependent helicase, partial [Coriobacteriales bacterium]|nr:ATP-dependent helicase [Coriobacteriales bacterium]
MIDPQRFAGELERLNDEQREAVTTLEGPVLVVAGPGTGKTQLLSLRVANILQNRDISPQNILCLTFTNAGAEAMRERLVSFIGRDAYEVTIGTFHSFAESLRSLYPEYFERGSFDQAISKLERAKLINRLLKELPVTDTLYQNPHDGLSGNLKSVSSLIEKIKKSGLSTDELLAVARQNEAFFDYFEQQHGELLERLQVNLQRGTREEKKILLDELKTSLLLELDALPAPLTTQLVALPGSYEPYALLLKRVIQETDFYDETGNSTGFRKGVRERFFKDTPLRFKDRKANAATCSALKLYEQYQDYLQSNALYDYDDMILGVHAALEKNPQFSAALRLQYSYILIDEFQDTNGAQMKIVESIVAGLEHPNILAVGDDDQAIMRFQGASVEFINQFEKKYHGTRTIVLKTNYRSVPELVTFGQQLADQIEERLAASKGEKRPLPARQHRPVKIPEISLRQYPSSEVQLYKTAEEIRALMDAGFFEQSVHPGSEIAIIARKHDSLKKLIPYLEHFGISFTYRAKREVDQISSLQTVFALMRYVAARAKGSLERAEAELPLIVAAPELGIASDALLTLACEAKAARSWVAALQNSADATLQELNSWLSDATRQAISAPVHEALLLLANRCGSYYETRRVQEPTALVEFNYGIKTLLDFAHEEVKAASPRRRAALELAGPLRLATVLDLLEEAKRFKVEVSVSVPLASKNALTLTTAHNAKGLEYDLVYLIDAESNSWKHRNIGAPLIAQNLYLSETEAEDDFRRLLFVAATRARDSLRVSLVGSNPVPELIGLLEPLTVELDLEGIEDIAP